MTQKQFWKDPYQTRLETEVTSVSAAGLTLKEIEGQTIFSALERNNWRRMATARELGIDKNTLRRKMIRLEIHEPDKSKKSRKK